MSTTSFFTDGKTYYSLCPPLTLELSRLPPLDKILNETLSMVLNNYETIASFLSDTYIQCIFSEAYIGRSSEMLHDSIIKELKTYGDIDHEEVDGLPVQLSNSTHHTSGGHHEQRIG